MMAGLGLAEPRPDDGRPTERREHADERRRRRRPRRPSRRSSDRLFADPRKRIDDFNFGKDTAVVFDDMLGRSVPFYDEIQRMTRPARRRLRRRRAPRSRPGLLDRRRRSSRSRSTCRATWTCASSASTTRTRCSTAPAPKLDAAGFDRPVELVYGDLNEGVKIENASVVLLVLTLQFVRPLHRERLIRSDPRGPVRQRLPDPGREGAGRELGLQPPVHQPLLRDEAAERLQRPRDRAEARGAGERAHAVPLRGEQGAAAPGRASATSTCSSSGTTSAPRSRRSDRHRPRGRAAPLVHGAAGNFLFHWRNALFPVVFLVVAAASKPLAPFGDERADLWMRRGRPRHRARRARRCASRSSGSPTSCAAARTGASTPTTWSSTGSSPTRATRCTSGT